jgi:hypothetical protein
MALLVFYPKSALPSYKGKSLAEWAQQLEANPLDRKERQEAKLAIHAICPGTIATIVAWLDYDPWPRNRKLFKALRVLPPSIRSAIQDGLLKDRKEMRAEMAQIVLTAIGPELGYEAAPAIPHLTELVNSTNNVISERATAVAARLGTNGLAILLAVAADENNARRDQALGAVTMMFYLGTNASSALPILVKCTQSKDTRIVRAAATALGMLEIEPDTSVPTLVAVLSNPDPKTRVSAIGALGHFAGNAASALQPLNNVLSDVDADVRKSATIVIRYITASIPTNSPSE